MTHRSLVAIISACAVAVTLAFPAAAFADDAPRPPAPPSSEALPETEEKPYSVFADPGVQAAVDAWRATGSATGDTLRVEIVFEAQDDVDAALMAADAVNVVPVADTLLVADVPFAALATLQRTAAVSFIRIPVEINTPQALTGGLAAGAHGDDILTKTNADEWHAAGFTGKGVKIGIIDYFDIDIWNAARNTGDLPAARGKFCRINGSPCNAWYSTDSEHGAAVAEIVHDMAPDADLYIGTAYTVADLKAVIDYFSSKGVKVITRSLVTVLDGPGNGTGPADEVVDYAVKKGMTWFNSAGNSAAYRSSGGYLVGGYWRGKWKDADGDRSLEFAPGVELLPVDCAYFQGLRWSDWSGNATDYDLYVRDDYLNIIGSSVLSQQQGATPIEGQNIDIDCDVYPYYYLQVYLPEAGNGTGGDVLEVMQNGNVYDYATSAGSAGGAISDSRNPGMASVGAVDPVAGSKIGVYSSRGPTNDGRIKPDISAGAGLTSETYSPDVFSGTSAATPVVAGAAALVLQAHPGYTPRQVVAFLTGHAVVDRGVSGRDNTYGAGELKLPDFPALTPKKPSISGTARVGNTMTAVVEAWGPGTVRLTYQWKRNGAAISGATSRTYTLNRHDLGTTLTVSVTGSRTGYSASSRTSAPEKVAAGVLKPQVPTISGTAKSGSILTAKPGAWAPTPLTLTYQWKRNGAAISGATTSTYKPVNADAGTSVTVTVTGSKLGYTGTSRTSAAVTIADLLPLSVPTLTVSGDPTETGQVRVDSTTWFGPTPVNVAYQWLRDGVPIPDATYHVLWPTEADLGHELSAEVTARKSGYTPATVVTDTYLVEVLGFDSNVPPEISGTLSPGSTLSATPGVFFPTPTSVTYQWEVDGVAVDGATASTFTAQPGSITVTVTAHRDNYLDRSRRNEIPVVVE